MTALLPRTEAVLTPVSERPPLPSRSFIVGRILHRKSLVFRNSWIAFLTGFTEPIFYLFSIGIGVGALVGGFEFNGRELEYAEYVAPGMLAAAAMNGAIYDATFNFFHHLKYDKLFEQWLCTPISTADIARSEVAWILFRGGLYSLVFWVVMVAMGLASSWWALLALPATLLISAAFAGLGMALTTYMRSWQDFDYVNLAVMPMLLFSGTFFPITSLPGPVRWVVELTPLYRGVVLCRELCTGAMTWASAASVGYLVLVAVGGAIVVGRRLEKILLT